MNGPKVPSPKPIRCNFPDAKPAANRNNAVKRAPSFNRPGPHVAINANGAAVEIAQQFHVLAEEFPGVPLKQQLASGLCIIFRREGHAYHLAFGRRDVYPADGEVKAWLRAFRVAPGAELSTGHAAGYCVIRTRWPAVYVEQGEMVMEGEG